MRDEEILDATCGGRTIWTEANKDRDDTLYIDKRRIEDPDDLESRRNQTYSIEPDEVQDFRDLPYQDGSFNLIVFDPPHLIREDGMEQLTGIIPKRYGALRAETWQGDIKQGFKELWRVLSPGGTLIFKFADNAADFQEVLSLTPVKPCFGTTARDGKTVTRWYTFYKPEDGRDA